MLAALAACGRIDFDPISARSAPPRIVVLGSSAALTTVDLDTYLDSRATSVTRTTDSALAIDATWLASFDLIVLENVGTIHTSAEADALASWVSAGGAIVSLTGYGAACPADADPANSLLASTGLTFGTTCIGTSEQITSFATHPVTQGLAQIHYFGGHDVSAGNGAVVIATDGSGNPVGGALALGAGRIVLWGDDWIGSDTDWTNPSNPLFWSNVLTWLEDKS